MDKYNSKKIYKGNLIQRVGKQNRLYKENVLLMYDENRDVFYSFLETFNLFLSKDLDSLSKEELDKTKKIIDEYTYSYNCDREGQVFVDGSSIEVLVANKECKGTLNK